MNIEMTENYYDWKEIFPELRILLDNFDVIKAEAEKISQWVPWPEDHFNVKEMESNAKEWRVFPLLHTFPANDVSKISWVPSTCSICPETAGLLRNVKNIRTALFSKLGPGTQLSAHTGWKELSNYVLRCHINLEVPQDGKCGLVVDGETQHHTTGDIIVFDDSKKHYAFNHSPLSDRIVLIIDILRPMGIAPGSASGSMTSELNTFMDMFK
jgi:aspartyl/asparaginyl beta-hydroxylase (cupin superfamily)